MHSTVTRSTDSQCLGIYGFLVGGDAYKVHLPVVTNSAVHWADGVFKRGTICVLPPVVSGAKSKFVEECQGRAKLVASAR